MDHDTTTPHDHPHDDDLLNEGRGTAPENEEGGTEVWAPAPVPWVAQPSAWPSVDLPARSSVVRSAPWVVRSPAKPLKATTRPVQAPGLWVAARPVP